MKKSAQFKFGLWQWTFNKLKILRRIYWKTWKCNIKFSNKKVWKELAADLNNEGTKLDARKRYTTFYSMFKIYLIKLRLLAEDDPFGVIKNFLNIQQHQKSKKLSGKCQEILIRHWKIVSNGNVNECAEFWKVYIK